MKIKLPKDKKKKRNLIITIVVLLLIIGSCGGHSKNSDEESSSDSRSSKMTETYEKTTTSETEKTTEAVTTEPTTADETIVVPDVRGMKFSDAKKQYEDFEFAVNKYLKAEEYPDFKPGDIISQEVEPGEELKKGDTIFVAVCQGKITDDTSETNDTVECPDLLGKDLQEAIEMFGDIITIEKAGEDYHPYIAQGRIIEQDIEVFSDIKKGTTVKVKTSLGPAPAETTPPEPVQPVETAPAEPVADVVHFILNMESGCVHADAGCSAAQNIAPENYGEIDIASDQLADYNGTYWACGKCSKPYSDVLPKF